MADNLINQIETGYLIVVTILLHCVNHNTRHLIFTVICSPINLEGNYLIPHFIQEDAKLKER